MTDINKMTDIELQKVTGGLDTTETSDTLAYLNKAQEKGLIDKSIYLKLLFYYSDEMQHEGNFALLVKKAEYAGIISNSLSIKLLEFFIKG